MAQVHALGIPSIEIGQVGGGSILDVEVKELASVYAGGLPKVMAN